MLFCDGGSCMNKIKNELWYSILKQSENKTTYKNIKPAFAQQAFNHLISCSRFLKVSVSKKSVIEISRPSQIFLIVVILGFLL